MNDIHRHVTELLRKVQCNPRQRKELEEELLDHLTLLYEEYMEKGYPPDEAERRALAAFGDAGKIGWEINRVWTGGNMRMRKWWMAIWLWLGIACMWKAYDLLMLSMHTDGEGIGVYFLGVEINDRVKLGEIPSYIAAFFGLGLVLLFQVWVYWRKAVGLNRKMD